MAATSQIIYKSPNPDVVIPQVSVFESILPVDDPYPAGRPALIDGVTGEVWTRKDLRTHSLTLAWAMVNRLGLREGEVVMILSPNSIQYAAVLLAVLAAGLTVTFANPTYTPNELAHQIQDSGTACVFAHPEALTSLKASLPSTFDIKQRVILMPHTSTIPASIRSEGWLLLDDLLVVPRSFSPVVIEGKAAIETTAFLYYSSGTTGRSKGVETTHYNMVAGFEMATSNWHACSPSHDIMLSVIPLYHITGGCVTMMYPIHRSTPIVVLPRFEPKSFLGTIEKYRITVMVIAPPILLFFQNSPLVDKYNMSSLKTIASGSAPASKELIENVMNRLRRIGAHQVAVGQAYGLTETSPGTNIVPPEWAQFKAATVGRLHPNMEARIVDDDERDVPLGSRGELWFRGPNVMKGYLNNPEATKNALTPDGWFKTGDIALIDPEGFWQIVDRKKELIKYKGFQVPPAELEALLIQNQLIADSGVVGIFSPEQQTELPRAYVVPRDPAVLTASPAVRAEFSRSIQEWVKTRVVHYKALRGGVVLLPAIPRSAAGKILRKDLRVLAETSVKAKL